MEILDHAWKFLLHPKSKVVPLKADVYIALGSCPDVTSHHRLFRSSVGNLTLNGICVSSKDKYDCFKITNEHILSDPQLLHSIQFQDSAAIENCLKTQIELHNQFKVKQSPSKVDCIVLWFDLYLSEEVKISTCPGSHLCWPQAVFALDSPIVMEDKNDFLDTHFQLKGSFELISVSKNGNCQNLQKETNNLLLPKSMIRKLNYEEFFVDLSVAKISSILDLTSVPIQSLIMMKNTPNLELTMFIEGDISRPKIDVVTEIATLNQLPLDNINGMTSFHHIQAEQFDMINFDPLVNGRLDSEALFHLKEYKKMHPNTLVNPSKLTLWTALIESEDLLNFHRVKADIEEGFWPQLSHEMNKFSCYHLQALKVDEFRFRTLSQSINVHNFDFQDLSTMEWCKEEFEVAIEERGQVHAILYWFEILDHQHNKQSTLKNCQLYDKAAFLLPRPVSVDAVKTDFVTLEFTFQDYLIDLALTD